MTFLVTLSSRPTSTVTLNYRTVPGTAVAADYGAKTGTITFTPTQVSKPVTIQIIGDAGEEDDQTFTLVISNPTGPVTILDGTGVGTIRNDD
jgi:hypothetical protein